MLGWESPPRIAGGLGVARYGLVKGLTHHGVQVTFVMPLRSGQEPTNAYRLLGANEIDIPARQHSDYHLLAAGTFLRGRDSLRALPRAAGAPHPYL